MPTAEPAKRGSTVVFRQGDVGDYWFNTILLCILGLGFCRFMVIAQWPWYAVITPPILCALITLAGLSFVVTIDDDGHGNVVLVESWIFGKKTYRFQVEDLDYLSGLGNEGLVVQSGAERFCVAGSNRMCFRMASHVLSLASSEQRSLLIGRELGLRK